MEKASSVIAAASVAVLVLFSGCLGWVSGTDVEKVTVHNGGGEDYAVVIDYLAGNRDVKDLVNVDSSTKAEGPENSGLVPDVVVVARYYEQMPNATSAREYSVENSLGTATVTLESGTYELTIVIGEDALSMTYERLD